MCKTLDDKYMTAYKLSKTDPLKSRDLYIEILNDSPYHIDAHHDLSTIYMILGDFQNAYLQARNYLSYYPDDYRAYNILGILEFQKHNYGCALEYFNKCLVINDKFLGSLQNIGMCYLKLRNFHKAEDYFLKALDVCKSDKTLFSIGLCNLLKCSYWEAKKYFDVISEKSRYEKYIKLNESLLNCNTVALNSVLNLLLKW